MGSIFLLLKNPVLLYWMYNTVNFTLLGGGTCCIPLKNVVLRSSMYLFRQSSILLSLLSNFVRPGSEHSLAQSSFTLTVMRPLLRTAWPPVYGEVFPLTGAFCELRITVYCSLEALPQPQVASDTNKCTDSNPFSVSGASSLCSPSSWVSAPQDKTSRSPNPIAVSSTQGDSWALSGLSLPAVQPLRSSRQ